MHSPGGAELLHRLDGVERLQHGFLDAGYREAAVEAVLEAFNCVGQPLVSVVTWKGLANAIEGCKNGLANGLAAACVKTVLQLFDTIRTPCSSSALPYISSFRDAFVLA